MLTPLSNPSVFTLLSVPGPELAIELCPLCKIPMIEKTNSTTGQRFIACPSYSLRLNRVCSVPTRTVMEEPVISYEDDENIDTFKWYYMNDRIPAYFKNQV